MRQQRYELLILGLLGILLIIASLLSVQSQRNEETDRQYGSTYANGDGGTRALYLWLDQLGYEVQRLQPSTFRLEEKGILWLLDPPQSLSQSEAEEISQWIAEGGILVWAASFPDQSLLEELEIERQAPFFATFQPVTPWIEHPDAQYPAFAHFTSSSENALVQPLLADNDGNLAALKKEIGAGELWLFASSEPFTNQGLHAAQNSALVEGLLRQLPKKTIIFDEFHHGFGGGGGDWSLAREMRRTPWGWGIYYGAIVLALWIVLHGRAFGRPITLPGEHLRREAGEYIQSMAWLYRRARLRLPILRHHHERLKRRLTARYRLRHTPDDETFIYELARYRPDLDQQALHAHLKALAQRRQPSEQQLLSLARANDEWLSML